MGEGADVGLGAQAAHVLQVEARRRQQQVGVEVAVPDQGAHEGEAVRVQARGRKPEDDVTGLAARAVDEVGALHESDAGAGEVELLVAVDPGQLRALAAEDRAPRFAADGRGALDELGDLLEVEGAGGDVVQEEERVGAGRDDVVDAVRGEVDARVEEPAGAARKDELRPDAVHRRGQEALVVQRMETCEAAHRAAGRSDRGAQALDDRLCLPQRHARGLVGAHASTSATSSGRPSGPAGRKRTMLSPRCTLVPSRSSSRISDSATAFSSGSCARRWSSPICSSSACASASSTQSRAGAPRAGSRPPW